MFLLDLLIIREYYENGDGYGYASIDCPIVDCADTLSLSWPEFHRVTSLGYGCFSYSDGWGHALPGS